MSVLDYLRNDNPNKLSLFDSNNFAFTFGELESITSTFSHRLRLRVLSLSLSFSSSPSTTGPPSPSRTPSSSSTSSSSIKPIVAVILPCCCHRVISYIAVLKAGFIYCPIDQQSDIEATLGSAAFTLIICNKRTRDICQHVLSHVDIPVIVIEDELLNAELEINLSTNDILLTEDSIAHLIFTSGTTGKPKAYYCDHWGSINSHLFRNKVLAFDDFEVTGCNIFGIYNLFLHI